MKRVELGEIDNHKDAYVDLDGDKEGIICCRVCGKAIGWQTRHCWSVTVEECNKEKVVK